MRRFTNTYYCAVSMILMLIASLAAIPPVSVRSDGGRVVYIQNSYTAGGYLYDGGGALRFGYPLKGDASYTWLLFDGYIQNAGTQRYISLSGHGAGDDSWAEPVRLSNSADDNALWDYDDVRGDASTTIFSSSQAFAGFAIHLEGAAAGGAIAQKILGEQVNWGNMRWFFRDESEVNFDAICRDGFCITDGEGGFLTADDNKVWRFVYENGQTSAYCDVTRLQTSDPLFVGGGITINGKIYNIVRAATVPGAVGDLVLADKPYMLRNSWTGLYIIEHGGNITYGNAAPTDKAAWWRVAYNAESGLSALINESTGDYVYSAGDRVAITSDEKYFWRLTRNTNDQYPEAVEFQDGQNSAAYLHMEGMNGFIEDSSAVQPNWGTPHWVPEDPAAMAAPADHAIEPPEGYIRITSGTAGLALYANQSGAVLCGDIEESDARGHWAFTKREDGAIVLQNREYETYLTNLGNGSLRAYSAAEAEKGGAWRLITDDDSFVLLNIWPGEPDFRQPLLTINDKTGQVNAANTRYTNPAGRWRIAAAPETAQKRITEAVDMSLYNELAEEAAKGRGANMPYTRYEAQDGETNGEVMPFSVAYHTIQSEASGRRAVRLTKTNDFVRVTLIKPANAITIRYCVPDAPEGGGLDFTLSLYADNQYICAVPMSSKQTWNYGSYPWTNNPADSNPHNFFDEARVLLPDTLPEGSVIKLQKGVSDYSTDYIIDLLEAEIAPPPKPKPDNALSLADYGSDADALARLIEDAAKNKKPAYIPDGVYMIDRAYSIESPVIITGAGVWYTTLQNASFYIKADNTTIEHMSLDGFADTRRDAEDPAAIESGAVDKLAIDNMWITHYKVGAWLNGARNASISNTRIRNTFADGVNFHAGVADSSISNCDFRSTGDDAIGLWSEVAANRRIEIHGNNIAVPWLANGIAIYGGADISIADNIISDTIYNGAGINISTNFKPVAPGGYINITRNTLLRCGSDGSAGEIGALWFNTVAGVDNAAEVAVNRNIIESAIYSGVTFENGGVLSNATLTENAITDAGMYGINILPTARGQLAVGGNLIAGAALEDIRNAAEERFAITEAQAPPEQAENGAKRGVSLKIAAICIGIGAICVCAGLLAKRRHR